MARQKGVPAWIKTNLIRGLYEESKKELGRVDKVAVTEQALEQLSNVPEIYDDFVALACWEKMRRLTNDYHTHQNSSHDAMQLTIEAGGEELQIPGLEDVRKDRFTIIKDGQEIAVDTIRADIDEVRIRLEDDKRIRAAYEQRIEFYEALVIAMKRKGVSRVRDLYEGIENS